jgi:protein-S-isoprenylcysteine O-methyltransferase Ste14
MRTKAAWLLVVPFLVLTRPTPALLATGGVLAALGLLIRAWSAGTIEKGQSLAVSGPYAFTRNPLYLGSFVIGIGLALTGGHWVWPAAFLVFFGTVYLPTMQREAERLTELFGSRYAEYARQVPTFLPRLTPYRPGPTQEDGFRWSRYLRYREWEALLGVVAALISMAIKVRLGW